MTIRNMMSRIPSKLLIGLAMLSVATAVGACTSGTDSATTTEESPIAASPSPMAESPMANSDTTGTTLDQVVAGNSSFSTLSTAIQAAGLGATLSGAEPYTIFAPTNEAFAALPPGTLDKLLLPENKADLQKVLSYHVVPGTVTSADITPGEVNTVEGSPVTIATDAGKVTVGTATVIEADITASNGVIHAIDQVLLPPSL